jgi:hypothetical protein
MKIVAFIVVFFTILLAMRWWSSHQAAQKRKQDREAEREKEKVDAFVQCARCQAHVPRASALLTNGKWKCLDPQCGTTKS